MNYQAALKWLVLNDDCDWAKADNDPDVPLSVTALFIADDFGKTEDQVRRDLKKEMQRKNEARFIKPKPWLPKTDKSKIAKLGPLSDAIREFAKHKRNS